MTAPYHAKTKLRARKKAKYLRRRGLRSIIWKKRRGWGITSKRR